MAITHSPETHLYQHIAEELEHLILHGTVKVGDKLPSVRALSKEKGISLSTAYQAYYQLEGKGLIEARPKSGYYVKFNPKQQRLQPEITVPDPVETEVSIEKMITSVFMSSYATHHTQFTIAAPSLELLPAARLKRSVIHALRTHPENGLNYEDFRGSAPLRKQISRLSINWGKVVDEEDVIITAGCMEALVMCLKAVTQPGDTVAIESPTYFGIFQVIQSLGLKVLEIPTHPETGIDIDYLEDAIGKFNISACLFVPSFNNPLGCLMPESHKRRLVKMLNTAGIPLIEDDIYGELYFGKHRPVTCQSFDKEGLVMLCGSLSKSLAPGYRTGWAIPGRFTEKVASLKLMHTIAGNTLIQAAMADFLEKGRYDLHLRGLRKNLHIQCLRYTQAIAEFFPPDTKISQPQGGFVLWIEMGNNINAYKIHKEALKYGISVAPGQIFSCQGIYNNSLRISYGKPYTASVEQGLATLGSIICKAGI